MRDGIRPMWGMIGLLVVLLSLALMRIDDLEHELGEAQKAKASSLDYQRGDVVIDFCQKVAEEHYLQGNEGRF